MRPSPNKRILPSVLLVLLLGAAGGALVWWRSAQPGLAGLGQYIAKRPRSIVLITLDTTRADHLEPYGATHVETPRLRRLAEEGVVMEQAYAVTPITLPSHTSIMTGLYPPQTGVRNNGIHYVSSELTTLAERLTGAGYRSGAFVSASVLERRYGLDQGFEIYDDDLSKSRMRMPRMVPDRPGEFTVAAARRWLDHLGAGEKFFLWVHLYDPHAAYNPPPPYRDTYRTNPYAGEIAYVDAQIAELLSHPRIEEAPEVVVSVIADHGESLGEHGENTHGILAYRATLHVPWLLWVKGAPLGLRFTRPVSQVDVAPTLLDVVGLLTPNHAMAGESLLGGISPERPIYSEATLSYYTYGWAKLEVMRRERWEYIQAPEEELYDLVRDQRELSNQALRRTEILHDLRGLLAEFKDTHARGETGEMALAVDADSLAKLRALGYVSMGSQPSETEDDAAKARPNPKAMVHLHTTLERARGFINERLFREAQSLLEKLLAEDPKNLAALTDLAQVHHELGELDEAVAVVERALAVEPSHQQLLLMMAQLEAGREQLERALALSDRVVELNRTHLSAWALRARLLDRLERHDAAEATLREALAIDPLHPALNVIFAQLVEVPAGKVVEAERRLRQASTRDPFHVAAWRALGGVFEHQGRLEEAEAVYREGLTFTPDDGALHALLAVLLARRQHPDAEAHLREAIARESEFRSELYVSLGALLAEKGRLDEAQKLYEQVLQKSPGHPAARNNRAIALARSGRLDDALKELSELVMKHPGYADAHNNLAVLLLGRHDLVGAEHHARKTIERAPAVAEAWDVLGTALLRQGRLGEALAALDRALELQPGYWSAHYNRALARLKGGDVHGARQDLEAALGANDSLPDAYLELAKLYEGPLNDRERARRYYRAFLTKFPEDERAGEVRRALVGSPPVTPER